MVEIADGRTERTAMMSADPVYDLAGADRRFPGFDLLSDAGWWDDVTRSVVVGSDRRRPPLDAVAPGGWRLVAGSRGVRMASRAEQSY